MWVGMLLAGAGGGGKIALQRRKKVVSCAMSIRNFENSRVVVYERLEDCGGKGDILVSSGSGSLYHDRTATYFSSSIYRVSLFPYSPETEVVKGHDISKSREKAFKDGDIVNYT